MSDYAFPIGLRANRFEHVPTDQHGRPVDATSETETQRTERIRALQDSWSPRDLPTAEPGAVFAEWMAASPANRMSPLAMRIGEHPEQLPVSELEPGAGEEPVPGGLWDTLRATMAERTARARRTWAR